MNTSRFSAPLWAEPKKDAVAKEKVSVAVDPRPVQTPPHEMLEGNHCISQPRQFYFSAFIPHPNLSNTLKRALKLIRKLHNCTLSVKSVLVQFSAKNKQLEDQILLH